MHVNQVIILLISLKITCLQTNPLMNILLSEKNFFHKINLQIHVLTNKIFNCLNLSQEFSKNTKVQALLAMHSDLNNIADKHSSVHDYIVNMTRPKEKRTSDLQKLFEDIINEEISQLKNDTIEHSNTFEEDFGFVNKLLDKITSIPVKDIIKVKTQRNIDARKLASHQKTRDIKVWHPQTSNEDKDTDNKTRRIYKGKKTRIKKYPFLVSIHVMNEFSCAGSIISKDLVITAATCLHVAYNSSLYLEKSHSILVRVGSDYTKRHGELIPVTEIFFHPGYDPVSLNNNLAIIRMVKRVMFSKKRKIQRIKYDRVGDLADDDNSVTILGWGAKDTNQDSSETNKVALARLDIYDIYECKEIYSRYYVTDKNFCAGFENKGGGACNRDVGGPGIISGNLVGIISFGPLVCGMTDAPTVFTKLSLYASWIDDIIKQKPRMRNSKTTKMVPKQPPRAFPMPVLTTSNPLHSVTEKSEPGIGTTDTIYPDEILILKEILQEIVLSNNSIIDYILYGDMLGNENSAKKILSTTEKVDVYHHPLVNNSIFLIERQNNLLPAIMKAAKLVTVDDDSSSNYDEVETGIKILESLVGFTAFNDKSTIAKARFNVKDNPEHTTTGKTTKNAEYVDRQDLYISQKNDPSDSGSYYEDGTGISIEANKELRITDPGSTSKYLDKTSSKSNTSFKRIQLEDYKNVIFNLNPSRESRGIITTGKKNNKHEKEREKSIKNKIRHVKSYTDILDKPSTRISTTDLKSIKLADHENVIFNLNRFREGRDTKAANKKHQKYTDRLDKNNNNNFRNIKADDKMKEINSETDDGLTMKQKMKTAENLPLGWTMAISDEDFDYNDKRTDKQEYHKNMRSRYDDREPILWRYRSI